MPPQNVLDQARRSQLGLMLSQAFGAPQGQFGTGLLQGSFLGQQEYQRTLEAFMAQQEEQKRADLERRIQEARLAQATAPPVDPVAERQRMEQMLMAGGFGQYQPEPPQPDPIQQRVQMEAALKQQGLGPYYQDPQPDPVAERVRMEAALKAGGLGSYYQQPKQPGQTQDPLWDRAVLEAGMIVRQGEMDPAQLETVTLEVYSALKAAEGRRAGATPQQAPGPAFQGVTSGRGTSAPASPLAALAKRPKPPPPPTLEGQGSGGGGSIRLQQLLAEHPEVNRETVEHARKKLKMTDDAIADLIESQLAAQGQQQLQPMAAH